MCQPYIKSATALSDSIILMMVLEAMMLGCSIRR